MAKSPPTRPETFFGAILQTASKTDPYGEYIEYTVQDDGPSYLDPGIYFRSGIHWVDGLLGFRDKIGLGSGRMTELFGLEKSGKSALAIQFAHQALFDHPTCQVLYVDMERALTSERLTSYPLFRTSGRFTIVCPSTLEQAISIVTAGLRKAHAHHITMFIVFDSVAAMRSTAEQKANDSGKRQSFNDQPIILSQELPRIRGMLSKTNSHLLMLNQIRDKMSTVSFATQDNTPGGHAIKFYADYRIRAINMGKWSLAYGKPKPKTLPSGFLSRIKTVKNKVGIPERYVDIPLVYVPSQGFPPGLSDCWAAFTTLKGAGIIKSIPGGLYSLPSKETRATFRRVEWAGVYKSLLDDVGAYTGAMKDAYRLWAQTLIKDEYSDGKDKTDYDTTSILDDDDEDEDGNEDAPED